MEPAMTISKGRRASPPGRDAVEADRWEAVRTRDRSADGKFVYAVRTTGVYCHPSCTSRLALRSNVTFYDTPAAAEAAGVRPSPFKSDKAGVQQRTAGKRKSKAHGGKKRHQQGP